MITWHIVNSHSPFWILYKYGPLMRAIWSFMDLRQQDWQAKPRSILLLKIHKTHIARHHRSIITLLYVKCLWLLKPIIFNTLLPFPVLQSGARCYYCDIILSNYHDIRYHGSTRVTFLSSNTTIWSHNSTIWCHNSIMWHHNITIWHHNSNTMMRGQYWKILLGQYCILSQYVPLLKVMWPGIDQSVWMEYLQ